MSLHPSEVASYLGNTVGAELISFGEKSETCWFGLECFTPQHIICSQTCLKKLPHFTATALLQLGVGGHGTSPEGRFSQDPLFSHMARQITGMDNLPSTKPPLAILDVGVQVSAML